MPDLLLSPYSPKSRTHKPNIPRTLESVRKVEFMYSSFCLKALGLLLIFSLFSFWEFSAGKFQDPWLVLNLWFGQGWLEPVDSLVSTSQTLGLWLKHLVTGRILKQMFC